MRAWIPRELRAVWYEGTDTAESCSAQDIEAWTQKMGRAPDAFGLYRYEMDGTQTHERDYPTAPQLLDILRDVESFWAGGDCPPDLMARIQSATRQAAGDAP